MNKPTLTAHISQYSLNEIQKVFLLQNLKTREESSILGLIQWPGIIGLLLSLVSCMFAIVITMTWTGEVADSEDELFRNIPVAEPLVVDTVEVIQLYSGTEISDAPSLGSSGKVLVTWPKVNIRSEPVECKDIYTKNNFCSNKASNGESFTVIGGPEQNSAGIWWWKIKISDEKCGSEGWIAERRCEFPEHTLLEYP